MPWSWITNSIVKKNNNNQVRYTITSIVLEVQCLFVVSLTYKNQTGGLQRQIKDTATTQRGYIGWGEKISSGSSLDHIIGGKSLNVIISPFGQ